jgi:2-methylcitrate dehydratase
MPYVVGAVLIDGAYTDAIFAPERFQDRRTLDLMKKITITEDADFNKRYPASLPCRMTITLKGGAQKTAELSNPIGHHDRPMSDAQVVEKFVVSPGGSSPAGALEKVLDRLWTIDNDDRLAVAVRRLRSAAERHTTVWCRSGKSAALGGLALPPVLGRKNLDVDVAVVAGGLHHGADRT